MSRMIVAAVMGLMLTASSVFAAEEQSAQVLAPALTAVASTLAQRTDLSGTHGAAQFKAPRRPMLLPGLYAGSALLQGYDAYSTLNALKSGATEANPLMKSVTRSPAMFIALKAGVATATIMSAERMWKDNHRVAAVVIMAASNGMMALVAKHNAGVIQRVR